MTTLSLQLEDDLYRLLDELAERHGLAVDQLVIQVLTEIALNPRTGTKILARLIVF